MAEKTRYSDAELEEFRAIIMEKLELAQRDYDRLKSTIMNKDGNDVDDTSPTYKVLEEGANTLSKDQKGIQFFQAENILQTHQRYRMHDFFKLAQRLSANTFGGRVGSSQLRICIFQFFQFPQKLVVFKIRELRIIQNIVSVIGLGQQGGQFLNSLFGVHNSLRFVKMCWGHPLR